MFKLKLQSLGHLMQRADSFEKTLMLGKIEGSRRRRWQRVKWLDGINYDNYETMAHSFIELDKAVVHVIRLVSFLWLLVCLSPDGEG